MRFPVATLLITLLALAGCTEATAPRAASAPSVVPAVGTSAPPASVAEDMLSRVNAERAARGLRPLAPHPTLNAVAQRHAEDMAARRQMSHRGSDGSTIGQRVRRAGYSHCLVAENIAFGQRSVAAVMAGWTASRPHQSNILHPRARHAGFGYTPRDGRSGPYWVQVFARPC